MASVYNFTFGGLTGINDDLCGISEKDIQNQNFWYYQTQNYFTNYWE